MPNSQNNLCRFPEIYEKCGLSLRKQYITLLEVLIAMSLMSILIVTVLGFYSQFEGINQEIAKQRQRAFYDLMMQNRLGNVIPFASIDKEYPWFYTQTEGEQTQLIFVYDNGVDGNPKLSGRVLGKLSLDSENRLILTTWPLPDKDFSESPLMRKEILHEKVQKLSFSFYQPPRRDIKERQIALEEDLPGWYPYWIKNKASIPPLMRILIEKENEAPLILAFVLVHASEPILYQSGESS